MRMISADSLHNRINPNHWPSELKTLGNEFNIMLDRLERSFKQLSQFSSDISHELRNPLHSLMSSTEIALTKYQTVDDIKHFLATQLDEYHYLSKLIENLLFIAKADHGQLQIEKSIVSSKSEIHKACDYFQAMADEKNIRLACDGDEFILVDTLLFNRAIVNLLSNALKYTPENGIVTISTTRMNDNKIQICINDSGIGIEDHHINRLFDRFYRADAARAQETGGLGLGLAIVKSIVDLHNGSIEVRSMAGTGTAIQLILPV